MRILLLTHSFNSLTQRLFAELVARGHELSVEFDIADSVTEEAVALFRPDVIVAPFLKRAIPASVWKSVSASWCIRASRATADRRRSTGRSRTGAATWGVTVLQANAEMDGGDIWASAGFPMREARKSSLYRHEVTAAALDGVLLALERLASGSFRPERLDYARADVRGRLRPLMRQADRRIDWAARRYPHRAREDPRGGRQPRRPRRGAGTFRVISTMPMRNRRCAVHRRVR